MADWTSLPDEILCIICKNVDTVIDYLQFSVVCKSWRFVAKCLCGFPLPQQPPRLMLPPQTKINSTTTTTTSRYFMVGLADGGKGFENKLYEIDINPKILHEYPCVGSAGNWLVLLDTKKHRLCIFNIVSKRKINLPPISTLGLLAWHCNYDDVKIYKVVLTSISFSNDSIIDCIAIAICDSGYIALARPGDVAWTKVGGTGNWRTKDDVIIIKNKLYVIDYNESLFIYNIDKDTLETIQVFRHDDRSLLHVSTSRYLVEWMGKLLLIRRCKDRKGRVTFKVAKQSSDVDYQWKSIEDLGNYSLFLGSCTSVAVSASECSSHKMNCIYHHSLVYERDIQERLIVIEVFDLKEQSNTNLCTEITMVDPPSAPVWIVSNSIKSQA